MTGKPQATSAPTPEGRDRVVAELCEHFAAGHMELDVLEARLEAVDEAESESELKALLADLPALPAQVPSVREPAKRRGWALALMGGHSRKGEWTPPRHLHAVAVMGGVELDFCDAKLAAGETHVTAVALMGGVEITVPPGLPVTVRGLGVMGSVEQMEQGGGQRSANQPGLKVTAVACMGGVEIKTLASEKAERIASTRKEKRR